MTSTQLIHFAIAMLTITNPVGNLAIYAGLTGDNTASERRHMALIAGIAIAVILVLVVWLGDFIMLAFGLTVGGFETAGGIIILLLGLSMLHSKTSAMSHTKEEHDEAVGKNSVAVVPMAIPIVAGPGAITTVIVQTQKFDDVGDKAMITAICLGIAVLLWLAFAVAGPVSRLLGVAGVSIVTRIMGMILSAIALQMLANGMKALLPGLA
ncbi:MAG: MarC family protein [Pseudomonadota bacterium]